MIYYRKINGFLFWAPTFFKSTYLRAQEDPEKNVNIDFDSELRALSIGDEIRAIRARLPGFLEP